MLPLSEISTPQDPTMEPNSYDSHLRNQNDHWWFNGRQEIIEDFFRSHEAQVKGGHVLDIGCGGGRLLNYLCTLGSIQSLDMEPTIVEHIKKTFGPNIGTLGSLPNNIPFPNSSFNLATLFDVLEHIPDDKAGMKKIHDLLKPNGLILLTVPAFKKLWSYHDEQSHHLRRYDANSIKTLLEECGFNVLRLSYFNTLLLPFILFFRFFRKLNTHDSLKMKNDMDYARKGMGKFLEIIFKKEKYLLRYGSLPFGLSLIVVGQRQ